MSKNGNSAGIVFIILITLAVVLGVAGLRPLGASQGIPVILTNFDPPTGFTRAEGYREWNFPEDYGPHLDFQTEWWYYTGNLQSKTGEQFGYQLTFFRRALLPIEDLPERQSAWAANQVFMAHFAITDVEAGAHHDFERFARGAAGLAGSENKLFRIWLENWRVEQVDDQRFTLLASQDDIKLDLFFDNLKGVIFHGEQGYSQKGPEPGNASYYYSQTRLDTSGTIQIAEDVYRVSGLSWMDHEFSTSALSAGQVGWDWFSIQLDEGSELMVFQIRRADGSIDLYSSGTWIAKDGKTRQLSNEQFEIKVIDTWRSPNSGAEYPSEWLLVVPDLELQLEIKPLVADQEMDVSYAYWEGAVKIEGNQSDARVSGIGYVELTGYAESIEGQF
jgi:predicted secreted hydrolase